ncbi:PepSY domain-containing protein [Promicromonospora sukumoe]|uniref:PepSY domain-containing protein n=1 Tax=Promicromonospora sukumoe TaxID=88382 RepID=UPI0037CCA8C0
MVRKMLVGAAAVGATGLIAFGGITVAGASTGGEDDGAVSHAYTSDQAGTATEAALAATGGGTANSVETDGENGATYEVEITKPDGATVDVRLDQNFEVVVIEGDGGS